MCFFEKIRQNLKKQEEKRMEFELKNSLPIRKQDLAAMMASVGFVSIFELIYSGIMFFFVRFVLKNKLNLE